MITNEQFTDNRCFIYTSPEDESMHDTSELIFDKKVYLHDIEKSKYRRNISVLQDDLSKMYYNVKISGSSDKNGSYIMIYCTTYDYDFRYDDLEHDFENTILELIYY